jgi:integrase
MSKTVIELPNGKFKGIVRNAGQKTQTKTFDKKKAAVAWATETDSQMATRKQFGGSMTLGQIIQKQYDENAASKTYKVSGTMAAYLAKKLAHEDVSLMTVQWWVDTVTGWKVAPVSAMRYRNAIVSALKDAQLLWNVVVDWDSVKGGMQMLLRRKLVAHGAHRDRRVSEDEITQLKKHVAHTLVPFADIIDFARLTALRVGELARIRFDDVDEAKRLLIVRNRKHPTKKETNTAAIPLLGNALEIIKRQPSVNARGETIECIFPFQATYMSQLLTDAAKRAGIEDIHFHDLRHEAITLLFELGYSIEEVMKVSGHHSYTHLQRYIHIKPEDLHKGPISQRIKPPVTLPPEPSTPQAAIPPKRQTPRLSMVR